MGSDLKGLPCNGGGQGYGPYDYTKANERGHIPVVEEHHFTPEVENHIRGKSGYLTGDLDYTLRAIPNHHKALLSTIRYQLKLNEKLLAKNRPLETPVECYLQRAIHFSPNDAASVSLFACYLFTIPETSGKFISLICSKVSCTLRITIINNSNRTRAWMGSNGI